MDDTRFADALRQILAARGLTQADIASAAGINKSTISNLLASRRPPSLDNLLRLAAALAVSVDQLLGRAELLPGRMPAEVLSDAVLLQELQKRLQDRNGKR